MITATFINKGSRMIHNDIFSQLSRNKDVFNNILKNRSKEQVVWKPSPGKWCMLEVLCHLIDEEKDDFRTRVRYVLNDPTQKLPPINPVELVTSKKYIQQDFNKKLDEFLTERDRSVEWLKSLTNPLWDSTYQHPTLGPMSAELFLANWLAHDYIHIRQLNRLAYEYQAFRSGIDLSYAGNW